MNSQVSLVESARMAVSLGIPVYAFRCPEELPLVRRLELGIGDWGSSHGGGVSTLGENERSMRSEWNSGDYPYGDGIIGNGTGDEAVMASTVAHGDIFPLQAP